MNPTNPSNLSSSGLPSQVNVVDEQYLNNALHQFAQQMQHEVQQRIDQAAAASSSSSSSSQSTQKIVVVQKPPLPQHDQWEGTVGMAITDWLESLELHHNYYDRNDSERMTATVALLKGAALKEYSISSKLKPPSNYDELCKLLKDRWSFVETEFFIRKAMVSLVQRGPAMSTHKYTEEFQRLAHRLPNDSQSNFIFNFISGLRPSIRIKVHERSHKTLQDAILHVCRMDATWTAHHSSGSHSSSGSSSFYSRANDSGDAMDITSLQSLGPLTEEDRIACVMALKSDSSDRSSTSTPSVQNNSSNNNINTDSINVLQQQLASLTQQLNAVTFNNRSKGNNNNNNKKKFNKGDRPPIPGLQSIPVNLRKLRESYGYCIKCGTTKFSAGENGHNARTCTNPIDKSTTPIEFRQGKTPNFQ
jgi:hypothetical protein